MKYAEALSFLNSQVNYERRCFDLHAMRLDRMRALLGALGHPEAHLRAIHIAGTKGKGTVAHYVARILDCAGYRVGLYTSPHLADVRERISVAGVAISRPEFAGGLAEIRQAVRPGLAKGLGKPTYFELLTACAFLYFRRKNVDFAVLETGVGGRWDATNVVRPLVSVLTSIGYDHQDVLGESLTAIAREKAEILKDSVPAVSDRQAGEAWRVIRGKARAVHAPLWLARSVRVSRARPGSLWFREHPPDGHAPLALATGHLIQARNAALVLRVIDCLNDSYHLQIKEDAIRRGFQSAPPAGRFEVWRARPLVLADGAHTPASVRAVVQSARALYPHRRFRALVAVSRGKDVRGILRELSRLGRPLWGTQVPGSRAIPAEELREAAGSLGLPMIVSRDPLRAFRKLLARSRREEGLVVTGSFYLVGLLRRKGRARCS